MKNRILCILFLHYHNFLHHSVKIGSDVFIYKTPHTSIPCLKIKPPLSNPHCIANLMHTINNINNANKLLRRKFSAWLHSCTTVSSCTQWAQPVKTEVFCSVPVSLSKQFLTFRRIYSQNYSATFRKTSAYGSTAVTSNLTQHNLHLSYYLMTSSKCCQ